MINCTKGFGFSFVLLMGLMSFVLIGKIETVQPQNQQVQTYRSADF